MTNKIITFVSFVFMIFLLFGKASTKGAGTNIGRRAQSARGGIRGSLGRAGARATRMSRESTMQISGQPVLASGRTTRWELTNTLNITPIGTVKRVSENRRPLQEGARVRVTRPTGERTVNPVNSATESFTESFESGG